MWLKNSPLFNYLRSGHDSIRYKFFYYPLDKLKLFFYTKILNKSWVDFYSKRLDKFVIENNYQIIKGYDDWGVKDLEFLKQNGLKPENFFLDFGCGFGRSGIELIPYLNKKNYYGLEISRARLEVAKKILNSKNIDQNNYTLVYNNSNLNISKIFSENVKFDFIYLNSVFTHTPYKDIDIILNQFTEILSKNGKIIFSALLKERNLKIKKTIKDYYYTYDELDELAKKNGFNLEIMKDWPVHRTPMFKLKRV